MQEDLNLEAYHYDLPEGSIAQQPADKRDNSRLMVLQTKDNSHLHRRFSDLHEYLQNGDMLVVNNTKVFPARLFGKKETGGKIEVFLLEFPKLVEGTTNTARANGLLKSSKRPQLGSTITISEELHCQVVDYLEGGKALLQLHFNEDLGLMRCLELAGNVPLPPYITRKEGSTKEDTTRYQTVYADQPGAVAAPTAGLHFTDALLAKLKDKGVTIGEVTLHVGYGTFAPVRETDITRHQIHREYLSIGQEVVDKVQETKLRGGKVWAVGTTSVRALEFGAKKTGTLQPMEDWCDLYIYPGFEFKVIDNLITNFHLPDSSLMFLVSALCGRETLLNCYASAIKKGYRFFSYGDAMTIIGDRP
ncbi:MAG: S-adenosylmethionine:tRNA ribosyltransferase-isomerase [Desulforhopalus sp.]|jgi:S-adenosylmethionine:tRNA ribosyltransferase-isomerase